MHVIQKIERETLIDKRYKVDGLIATGGSGAVYRAEDLHLERSVGLKFLQLSGVDDPDVALKRFELEARALNTLDHPNIVRVFRYGLFEEGTPYLALEFIDGKSLRQLLEERGNLSCAESISIAKCICAGMQYAHDHNIVHRDLKPENVILQNEVAKVVDFGLCKFSEERDEDNRLTRHGSITGTAAYMSPEQCAGKAGDARSDIYSFACILFELLTGQAPFIADTAAQVMLKQVNESPPTISSQLTSRKFGSPEMGRPSKEMLPDILLKCLQKDPAQRYQSFGDVLDDLNKITTPESASVFSSRDKTQIRKRQLRIKCVVLSSLLAVGLTGAAAASIYKDELAVRMACFSQVQSPSKSIETLRATFSDLLKEGKLDLAARMVATSTSSSQFSSWSQKSQLELLNSYFNCYEKARKTSEAHQMAINVLTRVLSLTSRTPKHPPEYLLSYLNSYSSYLRKAALSPEELKSLSAELGQSTSSFPKDYPAYIFETALLRADIAYQLSRRTIWNDTLRISEYYLYCMFVAKNSKELLPKSVAIGERIFQMLQANKDNANMDHGQLLKRAFEAHINLAEYYCSIGKLELANREMLGIKRHQQVMILSARETNLFNGCQLTYQKALKAERAKANVR